MPTQACLQKGFVTYSYDIIRYAYGIFTMVQSHRQAVALYVVVVCGTSEQRMCFIGTFYMHCVQYRDKQKDVET